MARLREKKRFREQRLLGIRTGIPKYIPAKLETRGFKLKFYDLTDAKIGEIGSDVKRGRISEVNFELLPLGCGAFSFVIDDFCDLFEITYRTRVDIHPYFDAAPWFTGFIQNLPQPGQERPYEYTGFGFYEQLDWVVVTGSYESQDIAEIVKDIIENIVAPNTQIVYNAAKVETTGYVVTKVDFDHVYAKDAIQTLADMAQGHEFGVDDSREFYLRPINTDVNYSFWVGKHCQDIEINEEPHTVRNKLYIKGGEIQTDGSNIIGNVSDAPSISAYGLREEILSVPEAINIDDAIRWAGQILEKKKIPLVKAKIKNAMFDTTKTKMTASGKIRVAVDKEKIEYTFYIKKIDYSISSTGILGSIELESPMTSQDLGAEGGGQPFELDGEGNLIPTTIYFLSDMAGFELDAKLNLMPTAQLTVYGDDYFELDSNKNLMPKEA